MKHEKILPANLGKSFKKLSGNKKASFFIKERVIEKFIDNLVPRVF